MYLKVFRQLRQGLHPLNRFQRDLRLKFRTMSFPLLGHPPDLFLNDGTKGYSTILTHCPNIGVHYKLNNQHPFQRTEINNIAPNWMLPPELPLLDSPIPQTIPKLQFRIGLIPPQTSSKRSQPW
jgi:hypothetical protein